MVGKYFEGLRLSRESSRCLRSAYRWQSAVAVPTSLPRVISPTGSDGVTAPSRQPADLLFAEPAGKPSNMMRNHNHTHPIIPIDHDKIATPYRVTFQLSSCIVQIYTRRPLVSNDTGGDWLCHVGEQVKAIAKIF